jgi:hypothetical protein
LESPRIFISHAVYVGLNGIVELGSDPICSFIRSP